jgi:hypothetical protein
MKKLSFLFAIIALALMTNAQVGLPVPDFGINGNSVGEHNRLSARNGFKTLVQSDGRIISLYEIGSSFGMARHLPDGSIDKSFGFEGFVSFYNVFIPLEAELQLDGKILVAGIEPFGVNISYVSVLRFKANGLPDDSFGNIGIGISRLDFSNFFF